MLLTRGQCRIIRTAKNGRNGSDSDFTNATSRLEVAPGRIFATGDPLSGKPPAADLAGMGGIDEVKNHHNVAELAVQLRRQRRSLFPSAGRK